MADFYITLGVTRDASDDEIKRAYRKLAMTYHPDRNNGAPEAEAKFKEITEAYDVLRDPNKRATYDRYGEAGLRGGGGGYHHVDLSEALNIFMRDLGGIAGFGELFGGSTGVTRELSGLSLVALRRRLSTGLPANRLTPAQQWTSMGALASQPRPNAISECESW